MSVQDGNPVNAVYTNEQLASKKDDNQLEGKQTLGHDNIESGADISDTQKTLNDHTAAIAKLALNNTAKFVFFYPNDAAFEAENLAPPYVDKVGFYFNTTILKLRVHDGTTWRTNEQALDQASVNDPTSNDDADDGYQILSLWLNTATGSLFRCIDTTVGGAIWQEVADNAILEAHINDLAIHVDWSQAGAGTIHPSNYVDNDTVYTHPNHSGEVTSTGDGAQAVHESAISNKADKPALLGTENVLIEDGGVLKKATIQSITDLIETGGVDALDTLANLTALPREQGKIYYATDTDLLYSDDGVILNIVGDASGITFWQKKLSSNLNADGTIADLNITGMTIGLSYQVKLIVQAARLATNANEIQEINFSATPTYGEFAIDYDGQTTALMPFDIDASGVQAALLALSNLTSGDVVVSGSFASGFVLTFAGTKAAQDLPEVTIPNNTLVTGEVGGTDEIQDIVFSAAPTSGTFTVTYDGETTAGIAYNASAGAVQAAIELLPNVNGVSVAALALGWRITFTGSLVGRKNINEVTAASSLSYDSITTPQPSNWPPNTIQNSWPATGSIGGAMPNAYYIGDSGSIQNIGLNGNGPWKWSVSNSFEYRQFFTPSAIGLVNFSFSAVPSAGSQNVRVDLVTDASRVATTGTVLANINNNTGATINYSTSVVLGANQYLTVRFMGTGNGSDLQLNNINMNGVSLIPVTTTPSTFSEGAPPVGGVGTIATPSTIAQGVTGIAGPAKLFGAKAVHDAAVIATAKTLPSAEAAEDFEDTVSTEEILTATATTMTVEAEGLGGPETLLSGETKLIVIERESSTEN